MKKLFAFFMTLLLVFGCEEIPLTPEAMITLDTEQSRNISIPSEGGVADISFTSALDWTAGIEYDSGEEGWISLNLTSGKGGYSIVRLKLNIHENLDPEKRSANVVIASGTEKVSISVTQDGHQNEGPIQEETPVFKLSDKKAEVGAEGGRIQVTVEFNVDYYYEISADWIKEVETKSVDSRIHTFEIAENTDETPRTGTISFCGNYSCIPFSVTQAAAEPKPYLDIDVDNLYMPVAGRSEKVGIASNVAWKVECDAEWLSVSPVAGEGDGSIDVNASANDGTELRSAVISISAADGSIVRSLVVIQEAEAKVFELKDKAADVGAEGGFIYVTVRHNVDYRCEVSSDWIKEIETKAIAENIHTFEIAANPSEESRSAVISFAGNGETIPFTVNQAGAEPEPYLEIDVESISIPEAGWTEKINVSSNVAWKVAWKADWLAFSPVSGEGDGSIEVKASANESTDIRSAVVTVSTSDGALIRSFAVIQEAEAKVFELNGKTAGIGAEGGIIYVTVRHNVDYRCEISADWIREIETRTVSENVHAFEISANPLFESRVAEVLFIGEDETIPFVVEQAGFEPDSYLMLNTNAWLMPAVCHETLNVIVSSNTSWHVVCDLDWVTVDPMSGEGDGSFGVTVTENESTEMREGKFVIQTDDGFVKSIFTLRQAGKEKSYLELDSSGLDIHAQYEGDPPIVKVRSNTGWVVVNEADWISVDPISGEGDGEFRIFVAKNDTPKERTTNLIVETVDGECRYEYPIWQSAGPAIFELPENSAEVKAEGGKVAVTVIANIEYSYEIPVEWIKEVDVVGNVHTFEIEANEDISQRRATISFCGNGNCLPFIITQAGKIPQNVLEVDRKDISVPASGTDAPLKVNVTSDTSWNVESDSGWCMITPSSGINNGAFNVTVGENASSEPRVALITVSSSDGFTSREIAVIQAPASSGTEDDSWQNEEFIHKSLALRFTADWCGYCPQMATALKNAQKELPDKIEAISVHGGGSGLASEASDALTNHYGISSFPTGLVDGWAWIQNYDIATTTQRFVNAVKSAESRFDVNTGASWTSTVSGNNIMLNLSIYVKKSGDYRVTALLVEDGVKGFQSGESDSYIHDAIIRESFTDVTGDPFTVSSGAEKKDFNYSAIIPDGCNVDNMRVVVYVQQMSGTSHVDNVASAEVGTVKHLSVKSGNWGSGNEGIVPGDDINL